MVFAYDSKIPPDVIMWSFYDKKPDKNELLSKKYHGKIDNIENLSIDDHHVFDKNGRCVAIWDHVNQFYKLV